MEFEIDIRPRIKRFELFTKRIMETNFIGGYQSAFKGTGLEFAGYREYTPRDSAKLIDWKASMRSNKLLVKEFVEERNLNVFFLVDVSSSMVFGSTAKLKNEYVAELVASLCYAIITAGDNVGFALYSDGAVKKSKPELGMKQFIKFLKALTDPKSYGGKFNLGGSLRFMSLFIPRNSLVIFVSDMIGLKKGFEKELITAAKKFDIVTILVRDPRDRTLPKGSQQMLISDPHTGEQLIIDPNIIRERYESYVKEEENRIKSIFNKAGIDILELSTDKSFIAPVLKFFLRRHKKWR